MLRNGTIESANWKKTRVQGLPPYLQLTIILDAPYYLEDRKVEKIFKSLSTLTYELGQLEKATRVKLVKDQKVKEGQSVPELIGKRLSVDILEAEYRKQIRLYVRDILPVGK